MAAQSAGSVVGAAAGSGYDCQAAEVGSLARGRPHWRRVPVRPPLAVVPPLRRAPPRAIGLEEGDVHALAVFGVRGRLLPRALVLLLILLPLADGHTAERAAAAGTTYYVDCIGGNDGNSGTASKLAWHSLSRANQAVLSPGESLLLKRGCTWT